MHILRDRRKEPFLNGLGFKIDDREYKMDGLTVNNFIICKTLEIAYKFHKELMSLKASETKLVLGIESEELLRLSDEQFDKMLYNNDVYLDNIFVDSRLGCITIQFQDYAIQKFHISTSPEILQNAEINDIWFLGEGELNALTYFNEDLQKDREKLIRYVKQGRICR